MLRAYVKSGRFSGPGWVALVGGFLLVQRAALAQAPVNPAANLRAGAPLQTGRMLDRNPQVGGGGYNFARPMSPLMNGNLIASGVAGRGMSLQSFSPIGAPTTFQASLGSSTLADFRRDSVSVASAALGATPYVQPYYDPSLTAPTAGFLQNLAGVRAPDADSPAALDLRIQSRLYNQQGLAAQIAGFSPPAAPASAVQAQAPPSALATASSIFGTPPPRLNLPTQGELPWRRALTSEGADRGLPRDETGAGGESPEGEAPGMSALLSKPLGGLLRTELYPQYGVISPQREAMRETAQPALKLPPETALGPTAPVVVDEQLMPGFDVLTDMQLAIALMSNPNAPWVDDMRRTLRERPELARQMGEQAAQDTTQFLQQMLNTPLRSLTGAGSSALNDQMLKAESSMSIGHYSEAVDRYDSAHMIDPTNPLPLIGKGHGLLAQGNYRSAAMTLVAGIELADRYPGLAPLLLKRLDLTALMGGGEIIDIRRADIMRQLQQQEDPSLRFLLGYLEYHTGDREHGLQNLKRAAENPRANMTIARYPTLLSREAAPALPAQSSPGGAKQPAPPSEDVRRETVPPRPAGELVVPPPPQ
jgi:tetratricopeptide (TPR) repeat protein